MFKGSGYSITLLLLFIIVAMSGDRVFAPPTPQAPPVKRQISPYVEISPFDHHFRAASDSLFGWDWKLLAAIAFTESRFDSTAQSEAGARGVMQVMPRTLRGTGVPDSLFMNPRRNIMAAATLLRELNHVYRRIKAPDERLSFILASYNAGAGHINDAMRLAQKYGRNRYKWEHNVDTFLTLKSRPEYYTDSLCRNGELKDWRQTIQFVKKVRRTWNRYRKMQERYSDSIYTILQSDSTAELMRI